MVCTHGPWLRRILGSSQEHAIDRLLSYTDRLLNNPHAQPPLPSDWEVHPTYPRLSTVPYYLAPLWDGELGRKATLAKEKRAKKSGLEKEASEKVAKELKETLKRARAARGLLQDLETEVRSFVERWSEAEQREATSEQSDGDSEDEEIVFVGRNGQTKKGKGHDRGGRSRREEREMDKLIFESLVDDHGARFGCALPVLTCGDGANGATGAGWSTRLALITAFGRGPLRLEIQRGERHTSPLVVQLEIHLCLCLVNSQGLCGAWFESIIERILACHTCQI